jgi:hypothetical protein
MYLQNKYTRWYYNIIQRAQTRTISGYTERHHIIPKSLGGSNSKSNLVVLTAREHFVCHWLLTKMVEGIFKQKMAYACKRMMHGGNKDQKRYKITSKVYANLKNNLNVILKNREFTNEWRSKLSKSAKIRCANESAGIKARKSKQLTEINISRKGIKKEYMKGEANVMHKDGVKDKVKSTFIEKYGVSNPSLIPYTCKHCNKSGRGLAGYKRWHGNNCRSLKSLNT